MGDKATNLKAYQKAYYKANRDKINARSKAYIMANKDKIKEYNIINKDKINIRKMTYRIANKDKMKEYYITNKDKMKARSDLYYIVNKENRKTYNITNKDKIKEYRKTYQNQRRKTDVNYRIKLYLRTRMRNALKGNSKSKRTIELLGCGIKQLKEHLKNQFTLGMNFKNYGFGWHIDHIIPCCSFNLSKEEEQRRCFHYTNLQPLWALENLSKGGKQNILNGCDN